MREPRRVAVVVCGGRGVWELWCLGVAVNESWFWGSGPNKGQSPVKWGEILSIRMSVPLQPSWQALRPLWQALMPFWQTISTL